MADAFELDCSVRKDRGKGASRRLRRLNDAIPAILYGGDKEPVSLTISHNDMLHATENEAFFSHIITLNIEDRKERAVIKELQRHPARPVILHADFQRVSDQQAIVVRVPVHFINEDKCVGVRLGGGNILKTLNEIEVSCLPNDLPEFIEVDMQPINVGESVHLSDITLPPRVTSVALAQSRENDLSVAIVQQPRGGTEGEATEEDEEAAEDSE